MGFCLAEPVEHSFIAIKRGFVSFLAARVESKLQSDGNYSEIFVATGTSVVVMVNYKSGKAIPIPEEVRKAIKDLEES